MSVSTRKIRNKSKCRKQISEDDAVDRDPFWSFHGDFLVISIRSEIRSCYGQS